MPETLLPNIVQFLEQIDPFNKLPNELLRCLAQKVKITYLTKGENINLRKQDEKYLYIIRTGSVEQRMKNGVLRARLGSEDLFGFTFLDAHTKEEKSYSVVSISHTLLYLIPHSALLKLFEDHPEYSEYFASQAQIRLKSALDVVWSNKDKGIFVKKVSEVACKKVAIVDANMSIKNVAIEMRIVHRSSSAVILDKGKIVGIITDRDITKRVVAQGVSSDEPISKVMTLHPYTVDPDSLVLHAASIMMEHNIRSLPVVKNKKVIGLLTTSHFVQNHRVQAIFLIEKIKYAENIEALSALNSERQAIFEALVEGHVLSSTTCKVMTMIMDACTKRLIQLGIDTFGPPPCDFVWLVAGSHARNEVHMLSDQDSALVLDDNATKADKYYFKCLAMYVCKGLDECGYPLCAGNYMAATPKWCQTMSVWKEYYKKWAASPEYECLLNITVFLEIRAIYGNAKFADELRNSMHDKISSNREFLGILVSEATKVTPPLGVFHNLVLEKSGANSKTLNIKKYALNLIIDLARIYGVAAKSVKSGTEERFKCAREKGLISEEAYTNIIGSYNFISQFRLNQQLQALKQGKIPDNQIDPYSFGSFERTHLKDAFRIISELQQATNLRFRNN